MFLQGGKAGDDKSNAANKSLASGKADRIAKMCLAADAAIADLLKEASCSLPSANSKAKADQSPATQPDFQVCFEHILHVRCVVHAINSRQILCV